MKPITISIKGFNSFVEEQNIDFRKLMSKGMFGIFGPTGSGKSSILDAITFALYGKIARESASHSQYININSNSAIVVFEFEVDSGTREKYKIIREIKRDKKGATKTSQCKIINTTNGEKVLGEKERETTEEIKKIIGLEYNDFIKTVVLPQGSFNEFIKLEGKDRREILERLFNLQRYGKILEEKIIKRTKLIETNQNILEGEIKSYGEVDSLLIKKQEDEIKEKEILKEKIEIEKQKSDLEFNNIKNIYTMQQNLKIQKNELEKELAKQNEYEVIENEIKNARKAEIIAPLIQEYNKLLEEGKLAKKVFLDIQNKHFNLENLQKKYREEFTNIEKKKNNEYIELLKLENKLNSLIDVYTNYQNNKIESQKLKKTIESSVISKEKLENVIKSNDEEIKKINDKIFNIDEYIKSQITKLEKKDSINNAIHLETKKLEITESMTKLKEEEYLSGKEKDDLDKKIKYSLENYDKISLEMERLDNKLQKIEKEEYVKPEYPITLKSEFEKNIEKLEKYNNIKSEIEKIDKEIQFIEGEINNLETSQKYFLKNIENLKEEFDIKSSQNIVNHIKTTLCDGESCPVCSNKVDLSKIEIKTKVDIEKISRNLEIEIAKEKNISDELLIRKQKIKIKQENRMILSNELEEMDVIDADLEKIKKDFEKKNNQYKIDIQVYNDLKEEYSNLKDKLNEFDREKQILNNNLKFINKSIEKTSDNLSEYQKNILKVESEILNLDIRGSLEELKNNFDEIKKIEEKIKKINIEKEEYIVQKEKLEEKGRTDNKTLQEIEKNIILYDEKLKTSNEIILNSEKMLYDSLGEIKNPKDDLLEISDTIRDIDESYNIIKKEKEDTEKKYLELSKEKLTSENKLKLLREQAREKQNNIYKNIQSQNIFDMNSLDDKGKLEKLKELSEIILIWFIGSEKISEKEDIISRYRKKIDEKQGAIQSLEKMIGDNIITKEHYDIAEQKNFDITKEFEKITKDLISLSTIYEENKSKIEKLKNILDKHKELSDKKDTLKELRDVVGAKKFVEFIAMKQLKYITLQATQRLNEITNGAYTLEVDDDGSFKIRDNKNGGALRTVKTLSGGETFVVSLSLALALSSHIQLKGVSPLELFFLDEGFGTLDDNLLEIVIDSLERIHNDRLNIGVISHIEQLKQRIPVKLVVTPAKAGEGGSKVKIEYS